MNQNQRRVIAVDVDDTLYEHFELLVAWHNRTFDTSLELADNHPFSAKHWGTEELRAATLGRWKAKSVEQAVTRVHQFFDTGEFRQSEPFEGAADALKALTDKHRIVVVTARDMFLEEFTRAWLSRHFGDVINDVVLTARYSLEGKARDKQDVFNDIDASFVIDDDLAVCQRAAAANMGAILFGDYPWNQTSDTSGIARCKDWLQVGEYFAARGRHGE